MDFTLTEEQTAVAGLAEEILTERATPERLDELDGEGRWFDRALWDDLAEAGLLGIALPGDVGGSGLGLLELALVLEQVGATTAYVPAWETLVLGAAPIDRFGTPAQRDEWLPAVAAGEAVLTAALADDGRVRAEEPVASARADGDGWRLEGRKTTVPVAPLADAILVSAVRGDAGPALFLVDPDAEDVRVTPQEVTNATPHAIVELNGAHVPADAALGGADGDGGAQLTWLLQAARTGLAAVQAGVTDRAVAMAAEYTREREQFGRPIASFQAVGQRVADAYIDAEAIRLTARQAAWRLAAGEPAGDAVTIAKWWACEAGHRVAHAAQHVHGGVGLDLDYPLHRYFRNAKRIEFTLGTAAEHERRLGASIAAATA